MKRRQFLTSSVAWLGGAAIAQPACLERWASNRFSLHFAPHFGMFKYSAGQDPIDQLEFAARRGFTAWEDKGLRGRPVPLQEQIGQALRALDMRLGAFVATASFHEVTFARKNAAVWQQVLRDIRDSVQVARRTGAGWLRVVPGHWDPALPEQQQTANCVELLRHCCEVVEPEGLVLVLEPIAWCGSRPGCFLHSLEQASHVCRAVGSPACKVLFDLYQQYQAGEDLVARIEQAWSELGYFQCGDGPSRREPGTGQIPYRDVFRHLAAQGFRGLLGMEHGNSRPGAAGEQAVIEAYARAEAC